MVCREVALHLYEKSIMLIRQQHVYNYTVRTFFMAFQSFSVAALLLAVHNLLEGELENFRAPEVFTHALRASFQRNGLRMRSAITR